MPRFLKTPVLVVNQHNQGIMIRLHLFLGISGKDAVLGPQKLSSELFASLEFLGQFLRSLDYIFPRIPRKKVESWPNTRSFLQV